MKKAQRESILLIVFAEKDSGLRTDVWHFGDMIGEGTLCMETIMHRPVHLSGVEEKRLLRAATPKDFLHDLNTAADVKYTLCMRCLNAYMRLC